ncbi:hypothetical protein [Panacagrimonas sp.]|uniref:hypothetical protein n=1 Tax=Panacagrimonas sp. TaxID=2480088 RepID=UPI003B5285BF
MNIRIDIERHKTVKLSPAQVQALTASAESTLKRFPKLRKLQVLGEQDFRLDMQTVGSKVAKIAHDVSFGARCIADPENAELRWQALPKVGNADLEGVIRYAAGNRLSLRVRGELRNVPVPLMYRLVAPAFIQGKFSALADAYLDRLSAGAEPVVQTQSASV